MASAVKIVFQAFVVEIVFQASAVEIVFQAFTFKVIFKAPTVKVIFKAPTVKEEIFQVAINNRLITVILTRWTLYSSLCVSEERQNTHPKKNSF
jgi:hypothetical protein